MRVRKYPTITGGPIEKPVKVRPEEVEDVEYIDQDEERPTVVPEVVPKKKSSPRGPAALFRKVIENPNFNVQIVVILLSLASENFSMDRRIDSMSSTVDKIRNVTDVINTTMQSVKSASDAPRQIRSLFDLKK